MHAGGSRGWDAASEDELGTTCEHAGRGLQRYVSRPQEVLQRRRRRRADEAEKKL